MLISALCVLLIASASAQSKKSEPAGGAPAKALEAKVRKAWEDYKNKTRPVSKRSSLMDSAK